MVKPLPSQCRGHEVRPQVGNLLIPHAARSDLKNLEVKRLLIPGCLCHIPHFRDASEALKAEELCFLPSGHGKESLPELSSLTYDWWQEGQEES